MSVTKKQAYLVNYFMHPCNDVCERVIEVYETDSEDGIDKVMATLEGDPEVKEIIDIVSKETLDVMARSLVLDSAKKRIFGIMEVLNKNEQQEIAKQIKNKYSEEK